jgi:hypothetical protein
MTFRENRTSFIAIIAAQGIAALLLAGTAFAGGGPTVSPNVRVNDPQGVFPADLPSRNTTTLAAGEEGDNLLAGWDDFQGFCGVFRPCTPPAVPGQSGFGFSTDGGLTWTDGGTPSPIGPAATAGHPWVDRGGEGDDEVFYYTSRMQAGAPTASAGIGVYRGHFGAGTFVFDDVQLLAPTTPGDYFSREAIAAAKDDSGAAYVVDVNLLKMCGQPAFGAGQIEVFRTHDGGDTWQGPVVVGVDQIDSNDPNDPACGLSGTLQVAPAVSIGDHGEVYVVWQHGPHLAANGTATPNSNIAFARSLDGGVTFSAPQDLVTINNMRENPPVGYGKNRMNDQPRIAVATTGSHHGRIYVTFYQSVQPVSSPTTVQSTVSSDIFLLYSDDQGQTWSAPVQIAAPVPPTGVKRFWPTVAVRPGGDVDIVYLESQETQATPNPTDNECSVLIGGGLRRTGRVSSLVDTYWIQSQDGGATFGAPVRVSEQTSNWCTATYLGVGVLYSNFGDYLGIAAGGNRTFTVWPDSRNGVADVFFAEIKGKSK